MEFTTIKITKEQILEKFSSYFREWLHTNYYQNYAKIGKDGDFYTAVSVGSLFGATVAKKIYSLKDEYDGKINLVEIGANEGYLMADIIQGLYAFMPNLRDKFNFIIIEPHKKLQELQQEFLHSKFGDEIEIKWLDSVEKMEFKSAIYIANELFDSFECELFNDGLMAYVKNGKLVWQKTDKECLNFAITYGIKKGELPLSLEKFIKNCCKNRAKFDFITFDYGEWEPRGDFSLRVYKNHNVYNFFEIENLNEFFGKSDITYDLNFSLLSSLFCKNKGVRKVAFMSQPRALIEFGVGEVMELLAAKGELAYKNGTLQLKRLLYEFGDKFKMIHFEKR